LAVIRTYLGREHINKAIALLMLVLGPVSLLGSVVYNSYVAAFVGLGLTFWGALLLYLVPSKRVKLDFLTATGVSSFADVERILTSSDSMLKGVYLPPKLLKDSESSLVFVPATSVTPLPKREEVETKKLCSKKPRGIYLNPPGLALSRLFEKELKVSFTQTDLNYLQRKLPLLFEKLEISRDAGMTANEDKVTVRISKHIFMPLCEETAKMRRAHEALGSTLSSALACALAKSTGKPIVIQKEETQDQTTIIEYEIMED
jgi:hypothetical protein